MMKQSARLDDHVDGRHDFDFFLGERRVRNRKLADPLAEGPDSRTWLEFEATAKAEPILVGLGNYNIFGPPLPGLSRFRAAFVRPPDRACRGRAGPGSARRASGPRSRWSPRDAHRDAPPGIGIRDAVGGRLEDVERAFARLLAEGRAASDLYPVMSTGSTLARVQRARGKLGAALRTYRDGLRFATEDGRLAAPHAGEPHVGMAQVLYERNQLDEALQHVTEGIELCRQVMVLRERDRGLVVLAWIRRPWETRRAPSRP